MLLSVFDLTIVVSKIKQNWYFTNNEQNPHTGHFRYAAEPPDKTKKRNEAKHKITPFYKSSIYNYELFSLLYPSEFVTSLFRGGHGEVQSWLKKCNGWCRRTPKLNFIAGNVPLRQTTFVSKNTWNWKGIKKNECLFRRQKLSHLFFNGSWMAVINFFLRAFHFFCGCFVS